MNRAVVVAVGFVLAACHRHTWPELAHERPQSAYGLDERVPASIVAEDGVPVGVLGVRLGDSVDAALKTLGAAGCTGSLLPMNTPEQPPPHPTGGRFDCAGGVLDGMEITFALRNAKVCGVAVRWPWYHPVSECGDFEIVRRRLFKRLGQPSEETPLPCDSDHWKSSGVDERSRWTRSKSRLLLQVVRPYDMNDGELRLGLDACPEQKSGQQ